MIWAECQLKHVEGLETNVQDKEDVVQGSCNSVPMYLLTKDHKMIKKGQIPLSRAIVASRGGMTYPLSNILSYLIEPLAAHIPGNCEVISTEDLLSQVDSLNYCLEKTNMEHDI